MLSNILDIFNPPSSSNPRNPPNPTEPLESDEPCLQCLTLSSLVMVGVGSYLSTGLVFRLKEGEQPNPNVSKNWKFTVKSFGAFVLGFGLYRGISAAKLAYSNQQKPLE